jgi:hypothetical protein
VAAREFRTDDPDGPASPSGRRLLCLAAAGHSFQGAADALAEFCGLKVCDNTVRSVALAAGRADREWRRTSPAAQADRGAVAGAARRGDDGIVLPALLGPVGRLLVGRRVSAGIGYRTAVRRRLRSRLAAAGRCAA